MPRVLVAGFCAVPRGDRAGVQIPHVLRALAERYTVEVLTVREGDRAYVEQFRHTRMLRVPVPNESVRERIQTYQRALRRQLEGADYAVVHCCDLWSALPALKVRGRLGYLVVYDAARRRPLTNADGSLDRERRRDEEWCLQQADVVLAPTKEAEHHYVSKSAQSVRLVPLGVDVDTFDWDWGEPTSAPEVLCAGPVAAGRGLELLLRAMGEVCARTDARLRLLGEVDEEFAAVLDRETEANDLRGRVIVSDPIDNEDLPRAIARAAVCVAPAADDLSRRPDGACPTKILESMACQRAVVAPRTDAVTAVIQDGEQGLLFAPDDSSDLAAQILRLLADGDLAARLARGGYRLVRERYTASATRRALRDAYREIESRMPDHDDHPHLRAAASSAEQLTEDITDSQIEAGTSTDALIADDRIAVDAVYTAISSATEEDDMTAIDCARVGSEHGWIVGESAPVESSASHVPVDDGTTAETTSPLPAPASGGRGGDAIPETLADDGAVGNRVAAGEFEARAVDGQVSRPTDQGDAAGLAVTAPLLRPAAASDTEPTAAEGADSESE